VGLGAAMDGIECLPRELKGVEDFPKMTSALLGGGTVKKIFLKYWPAIL